MLIINYRSSHHSCAVKKCVLKNFPEFMGKKLCQSLFFNRVAGPAADALQNRCFKNFTVFAADHLLKRDSNASVFM